MEYENYSRKLSCGVIVIKNGKILLLHVNEQDHWDIPKGTQSEGESPIETAIRKLEEETSLALSESDLLELGWYQYNSFKDLYLFAYFNNEVDEKSLYCKGNFENNYTMKKYGADEFRFFSLDMLEDLVCPSMKRLMSVDLLSHIKNEISKQKQK